jgi:hypothetical protein
MNELLILLLLLIAGGVSGDELGAALTLAGMGGLKHASFAFADNIGVSKSAPAYATASSSRFIGRDKNGEELNPEVGDDDKDVDDVVKVGNNDDNTQESADGLNLVGGSTADIERQKKEEEKELIKGPKDGPVPEAPLTKTQAIARGCDMKPPFIYGCISTMFGSKSSKNHSRERERERERNL